MVTASDVGRINSDYQLSPPLTLDVARAVASVTRYLRGRRALVFNYGDDLAASVESAILQCNDR